MKSKPKARKAPYFEKVAQQIILSLEDGTAPWVKPWNPGELAYPHNPVTGARYHGTNTVKLLAQHRPDPRWMTYKQALDVGAQVARGEAGTTLIYWVIPHKEKEGAQEQKQDNQKQEKREEGQRVAARFTVFTVFNAAQIHGLEPWEPEPAPAEWERHARAEKILETSGATIIHSGVSAYYSPSKDEIYLPPASSFPSADGYYSTALHELGHWTGHESRLNRGNMTASFKSAEYAKEELRAEISSMMVGMELGIGHDPGQHVAYIGEWIKILKKDPNEIFTACRDAEKIKEKIMSFDLEKETEQVMEKVQEPAATASRNNDKKTTLSWVNSPACRKAAEDEKQNPVFQLTPGRNSDYRGCVRGGSRAATPPPLSPDDVLLRQALSCPPAA